MSEDGPAEIPIDGVLDLHAFRAEEVKTLVPDYLEECRRRGIYDVRIIHGKGTGALRRTVHSLLARNPIVAGFRTADLSGGGWGATEVVLKHEAKKHKRGERPARIDRLAGGGASGRHRG